MDSIRRLRPDNARVRRLSQDDRVIVSEPFADLPGAWHEIPPASALTVRRGGVLEHQPFQPQPNAAHVVSAQATAAGCAVAAAGSAASDVVGSRRVTESDSSAASATAPRESRSASSWAAP